ncbi:DUF2905 domain-containing protein [Candidatus Daviesbacteria bacterium]|nr:DUF2905 domain-containing protein [Candidatus Daviesbacteria bacterium]
MDIFETIKQGFYLLVGVFLVLTLLVNLNPRLPRFPWDILLDRFGFRVYLPVTTAIALTMILTILMQVMGK